MSAAIERLPLRKQWTQDEVSELLATGILAGQRLELIEGDLIDRMGQDPPHASVIQALQDLFVPMFPGLVRAQLPMQVSRPDQRFNLPEPDLAILLEKSAEYKARHPRGSEMRLVIEVSDASWRTDSDTKKNLYQRAGVPVYWIIDLKGRKIRVHVLQPDGAYQFTDETGIVSFETTSYRVSDILDALI